ncbi:MAG: acyl-CoA dehydrogenase family protein, partial [Actinomycetota bacterium]|nr:acyl-CoA dehydrogenase family protein [Actinomycetota bacterium]
MTTLSREHEEFRLVVREFAAAEIAPHIAEWDKK